MRRPPTERLPTIFVRALTKQKATTIRPSQIIQRRSRLTPITLTRTLVGASSTRSRATTTDAIADYAKAIEIDPRYANAYVGRGMVYRLKGDNDHAIADYTQAIEINPRYAIAYFNRGSAFEAKGEHDRAIADFTKAIELTPQDAKAYVRRGIVYQADGRQRSRDRRLQ